MQSIRVISASTLAFAAMAALWHWSTVSADTGAGNLLVNGHFSDWTNDRPAGWEWRAEPQGVRRLDETRAGRPVVSIRENNAIYQDLSGLKLHRDDRVIFEGYMRTGEDNMVFADITLYYEGGPDDRVMERQFVPSGGWQYMRLVIRVPRDGTELVRFAIHMRDETTSPLLLSGLTARVVPGMP